MSKKRIQNNFDLDEFKNVKEQLKKAYGEAKADEEERKSRGKAIPKQSLGQKIFGFIILIAILAGVGFAIWSNLDMFFLPKNSVTIVVADQYGNPVPGLTIHVDSDENSFRIEYSEDSTPEITNLGVKPGEYTLHFYSIPEGYSYSKVMDKFTLQSGSKVKLEYEFIKENANVDEDENENENEENNIASSNDKLEIEKQLNLILNNRDLWYKDTEWDKYSYAITDLDKNGRIEIISSICQGSGVFTHTEIYEVNENVDDLKLCESNLAEYDTYGDIIKDEFVVFYDSINNQYHYIFDDLTRNGAAEYYENKRDFCLSDGVINEKYLVYKSTIYEDEIPNIVCTDLNDNTITEEEYDNFEDKYFSDFEKMKVKIEWLTNYTEIELDDLQHSYNNFSIYGA